MWCQGGGFSLRCIESGVKPLLAGALVALTKQQPTTETRSYIANERGPNYPLGAVRPGVPFDFWSACAHGLFCRFSVGTCGTCFAPTPPVVPFLCSRAHAQGWAQLRAQGHNCRKARFLADRPLGELTPGGWLRISHDKLLGRTVLHPPLGWIRRIAVGHAVTGLRE